jgi:hypothetical protein
MILLSGFQVEYIQWMLTRMLLCVEPEVYAAREKNGIYLPRERYFQDEAEKKVINFGFQLKFSAGDAE